MTWSLFFIFLLYFTAPALAVLVKFDVYTLLVGSEFAKLPQWVAAWQKVDPTLLSITDVNRDGIVQLAEIAIGGDIIVLATPEIAGLPYVISGLVAAGGLAAALSTADGLLLTIANALSHDLYYKMIDPHALHAAPRDDLEGPAAGRGVDRGVGGEPEAGRHPVPGVRGVLARGGGVLPGAGARHLLEARQQVGRDARHARRASASRSTTWRRPSRGCAACSACTAPIADDIWWGIQPISAGILGRAARLRGDHHRQPADAGARTRKRRSWSSTCATRTCEATSTRQAT